MSTHKPLIALLEAQELMDALLQIIFNVMKTMNKDDLKIKKYLMVDVGGTKIGTLYSN